MAARKRMQPLIRAILEQNFYKIYSLFYAQVDILAFCGSPFLVPLRFFSGSVITGNV
jgi:hypothetical protein